MTYGEHLRSMVALAHAAPLETHRCQCRCERCKAKNGVPEMTAEPLSAYVRRCRAQPPEGPDWLADEIQGLEDAFAHCIARDGGCPPDVQAADGP